MAESSTVTPAAAVSVSSISLREYVDIRFEAAQKAIDKAEAASEKRFEGVNEFRASLADQSRLLMPRSEAEQQFKTIAEKIDVLTARINARDDRGAGMSQGWLWLVGGVAVIGTIAGAVALFSNGT